MWADYVWKFPACIYKAAPSVVLQGADSNWRLLCNERELWTQRKHVPASNQWEDGGNCDPSGDQLTRRVCVLNGMPDISCVGVQVMHSLENMKVCPLRHINEIILRRLTYTGGYTEHCWTHIPLPSLPLPLTITFHALIFINFNYDKMKMNNLHAGIGMCL